MLAFNSNGNSEGSVSKTVQAIGLYRFHVRFAMCHRIHHSVSQPLGAAQSKQKEYGTLALPDYQ